MNRFRLALAGLLAVALLLPACDSKKKSKWRPPAEKASLGTPQERFSEARLLMSDGKNAEAAKILRKLADEEKFPSPVQNWCMLWAGFAELLAGNEKEARPVFAKLAERGPFVTQGGDKELADWFVDVGAQMGGDKPIPGAVTSKYNRHDHEALALYLYALKNENLGKTEEALTMYRQFTTSTQEAEEPWAGFNNQLKQHRVAAEAILVFEDQVEAAVKAVSDGGTGAAEKKKKALATAKKEREKIKRGGKLIAALNKKIDEMEGRLGEQMKASAEQEKAEADLWGPALAEWKKMMDAMRFADAKSAVMQVDILSESGKAKQERYAARADYLEKFKFFLATEISVVGYKQPVELKNGDKVEGGVVKLDDQSIYLKMPDGEKAVSWNDVSKESIFTMAKSLVLPGEAADSAAFRKFHLGAFAAYLGKTAEAKKLIDEAVQTSKDFAPDASIVLGEEAPPPKE